MGNDLLTTIYNPDVLTCLANLSNDEVFTPPQVVNDMLDMLPQELFSDPNTTFLDPACKSGVFLREIAKRLIDGLEDQIPNLQERLDHIYHKQLFGIAITELTGLASRRSLYCSKYPNRKYSVSHFDNVQGNIRYKNSEHVFKNGKCIFCGASEENFDKSKRNGMDLHAYELIHTTRPEGIWNMKFDVIIGNPPYQLEDNGNAASASPIYQFFVKQAEKLNPRYLCMIIPARWYAGGKGLDDFRESMLADNHIKYLVDIPNSADCFPGVNIAGGICYFLRDRSFSGNCEIKNLKEGRLLSTTTRPLNEFRYFVRNNTAISIIKKVNDFHEKTLQDFVFPRNYFGLPTTVSKTKETIGVVPTLSSKGFINVDRKLVVDKNNIISKYKVVITYAMSGGNKPTSDGNYQIVSSLTILKPGEACTETFLILGCFDNVSEAKNLCSYVSSKFFRFLLLQTLSSIHITRDKFLFVPIQDYSSFWNDQKLYKKYNINKEEQGLVETSIKEMNSKECEQ